MSDLIVSWLRTIVPAVWGTAIAYVVAKGFLPADFVEQAQAFSVVLVAVAIAVYYALVRLVEPYLPSVLAAILIGHPDQPLYVSDKPES